MTYFQTFLREFILKLFVDTILIQEHFPKIEIFWLWMLLNLHNIWMVKDVEGWVCY